MSRHFLTSLNLNKNELLNAAIQSLANAPLNPSIGQVYFDTGLNKLRQWTGTAWLTYVSSDGGGQFISSVGDNLTVTAGELTLDNTVVITTDTQTLTNKALGSNTTLSADLDADSNKITNVATPTVGGDAANKQYVDDQTTDEVAEGTTNKYFTDDRAKDSAGDLLANASKTNIQITYDSGTNALAITAENGVADSTTDDLTEGTTNLYFTAERALSATASAYDPAGSAATAQQNAEDYADGLAVNYDPAGTTSTHSGLTTGVHGVSGDVVGTSDSQTLTNKTIGSGSFLGADLDADGFTITGLATPVNGGDAANKDYVDNIAAGLTWKAAVNLLANVNVALTGDSGDLVIDGHDALVTADVGYRILLTNQTVSSEDGIYVYTEAAGVYTLVRSTDADTYQELINATVFVNEGTTYGQSAWTQANHYLTSFAAQDWVQFSGAAQINAGAGLTKDGNTLDVVGTADRITVNVDSVDIASTYAGQSSITTVGTITSGTWNGTDIAIADGGTGASTAADARANLGATTKYAASNAALTATSGAVSWVVTHSLNTRDVTVQLFDLATYEQVEVDVVRTSTNVVTLSWISGDVNADSYRVVVVG